MGPQLQVRPGPGAIQATHKAKEALPVPPGTEGNFWRGDACLPTE